MTQLIDELPAGVVEGVYVLWLDRPVLFISCRLYFHLMLSLVLVYSSDYNFFELPGCLLSSVYYCLIVIVIIIIIGTKIVIAIILLLDWKRALRL